MTASTFSELELDESLITALTNKGYERPTAIQEAAIRLSLRRFEKTYSLLSLFCLFYFYFLNVELISLQQIGIRT